jgi:acetyltransferase-like isoleucine patch superfamily enzyme
MENLFFDLSRLKYLGENCIIGKSVRIRKPEECIIGDGTIIDDFTYISCPIEIGNNCHIASNVSISGGSGKLVMGNYSTISNHSSLHCASSDYSKVSLDLPSVPPGLRFGGTVGIIEIGSFVTIGAHTCVLPDTVLPDGFACGAFSLLKGQNYFEWSLYTGIPARFRSSRDQSSLSSSLLSNSLNFKK